MLRKILVTLAAAAFSISACAQVKLAGHIYVPSSTDSNAGEYYVNWTADGDCTLETATNCAVYTTDSLVTTAGADGPYVGTLQLNDASFRLTEPTSITLPASPGREYGIQNDTDYTITVFPGYIQVPSGAFVIIRDSAGQYYQTNGGITNNTPNTLVFPASSSVTLGEGSNFNTVYFQLINGEVGTGGESIACFGYYQSDYNQFAIGYHENTAQNCDPTQYRYGWVFQGDNYQTKAIGPIALDSSFSNGTCATSASIAYSNGNHQSLTLTAGNTCALSFVQPPEGTFNLTLKITQASTPTGAISTAAVYWPGGTTPTITTTANAVDFISCYLDGTNTYCVPSQNFAL